MTDEVQAAEETHADPLAKAIENGFVEPEALSREVRSAAVIRDVGHAMENNSPVSLATFAELKDLLAAG